MGEQSMNRYLVRATVALGTLMAAAPAGAAVVSLNFEGITPHPHPNNTVFVQEYYNGGTSSVGTSGANVGASFGDNALVICLNTESVGCSNTSRGGTPDSAGSRLGALFFLAGDETFLNYAAGFTTGFSFNYVSLSFSGSVTVYDGLNGTGNLLATLDLTPNAGSCPGFGGRFCPFSPIGVAFAGTARSISFGGIANQIVFDDITFGSDRPGGGGGTEVPVPAALGLFGLALAGFAATRRRA
jgi:hypothetical protein